MVTLLCFLHFCRIRYCLITSFAEFELWRSCFSRTSFNFTATSCGQHLSCCVWQLDQSMELRKLTSTASLSSYRRSCSERHRTSLTSTILEVLRYLCLSEIDKHTNLACNLLSFGDPTSKYNYIIVPPKAGWTDLICHIHQHYHRQWLSNIEWSTTTTRVS